MAAAINIPTRTVEVPVASRLLSYLPRLVNAAEYIRENPNPVYFHDGREPDFYDTVKIAADMGAAAGKLVTPPDAGEEQQIYVHEILTPDDILNAEGLRDYFGNNEQSWHAWAHTLTGLKFREADLRKPYNIGDEITAEVIVADVLSWLEEIADPQFTRENWKDIIGKINQTRGKVAVPYTRGQVIEEMDPHLGIWTRIRNTGEHEAPHALHAWLRENLNIPRDPISGYYEVAVGRRGGWPHAGRCLGVAAHWRRWDAASAGGFRPVVRGSLKKENS